MRPRDVDDVVRVMLDVLVAVRRDCDHVCAAPASPGWLEITLSYTCESVATHTTGVWSSRSAIGPCFISPAEYDSVGMYEISFSFSPALEAHGQTHMASEVEEERLVVVALRDLVDRVIARKEVRHLRRELVYLVEERGDLLLRQRLSHLRELERDDRAARPAP